MDKKRLVKMLPEEDLKGFEEFIETQPDDAIFPQKGHAPQKKEITFENYSTLLNDSTRLNRIKDLILEKLPMATRYDQGQQLLAMQQKEIEACRQQIVAISMREDSGFMKSVSEIFDGYFEPPKP